MRINVSILNSNLFTKPVAHWQEMLLVVFVLVSGPLLPPPQKYFAQLDGTTTVYKSVHQK